MLTFLEILGSLGVFLYGMKVLSEGIQRVAGQRMRHVMATMTKNRFSGILTGFGITCLLQSSSATTVIVVSFVNAGLLTLIESISVIMGANLGTTITAWIIASVGKFSVAKVAIPMIGIGLPFFFIGKHRLKNLGEAAIGFGLLFLGLGLLKDSVPDADAVQQQAAELKNLIVGLSGHGYLSYLGFLALGVILTLVVQSSSAAMAITVTLAINGWIGFEESAFVVLGENIGTTVTAWLASLGANHHAKRAARAHFTFNILGVVWMLAAFPLFAQLVEWLALTLPESLRTEKHTSDIGFKLAIFHTLFNFINICILVALVPWIAGFVSRWVKEPADPSEERSKLTYITQNLVNTGELNLPEGEKASLELAGLTDTMFRGFRDLLDRPDQDLTEQVQILRKMEEEADRRTEEITEYLVRCSAADIGQQNAVEVAQMLRIASELESITDSIHRLVKLARRKYRKQHHFSSETTEGIRNFADQVSEFIQLYNDRLFQPITLSEMQRALTLEDEIDARRKQLNRSAMLRMSAERADLEAEILAMEIHNQCEKIGNDALNIMQACYMMTHKEEAPERIGEEVDKIASSLERDRKSH